MKIQAKDFFYISNNHDTLTITIHALGGILARPILWNNKGLFCIISRQKVQNILDVMRDNENLPTLTRKEVNKFYWDDGEPIAARAAAMLLS